MVRKDQTSDAQLRIGESRYSGFALRAPRNDSSALNLIAPAVTHHKAFSRIRTTHEDRVAGSAWFGVGNIGRRSPWPRSRPRLGEIFKTTSFEGYRGVLVFFTFMPLGAAIGAIGGALLFGVIAIRDAEIAIEREPARPADR
jgi:hypothetical protein